MTMFSGEIRRAPDFTPEEIRRMEDDDAESGEEFEIVTGPPYPHKIPLTADQRGFYWIETDGKINFADTMYRAMWDRREYILEILSA